MRKLSTQEFNAICNAGILGIYRMGLVGDSEVADLVAIAKAKGERP